MLSDRNQAGGSYYRIPLVGKTRIGKFTETDVDSAYQGLGEGVGVTASWLEVLFAV